ncbi:MAG: heavy metal translocating P-type ATPase [Lachnospiraceae bacterium]|nr:heavy metal translocating P-type ATPase [Lachnospiraceae bacterium]
MRFRIKDEIRGRVRVHFMQSAMTARQADTVEYMLMQYPFITKVKVYERSGDVVVCYKGNRDEVIRVLQRFHYETAQVPQTYLQNSGRELNREYWDKLVGKVVVHYGTKLLFPCSVRNAIAALKSVKYIWQGICTLAHWKLEVPVLDATAIGASVVRGDCSTASSVMFLLEVGEILEEWTHKKSVGDLARSMSLNINKVWLVRDGQEILVSAETIQPNDLVRVHMGNVIPFDGIVAEGEAMVNQSSLTGESMPVRKLTDGYVYAGTVLEEGELTICVKEANGSSKYEKIGAMIEESEKLKSSLESKAEHLADKLVPYTFAGTILTYLLTRNVTKTISVLMVDFSCALKLAMPLAVLSAIREASTYDLTVKGGKFLEAVAEADTIVFDKTGTLTKARPTVKKIVSFHGESEQELLRVAACLEEHFPHSMAKAVVEAAQDEGIEHEEMHSKVEYIVAHGISSMVEDKKVVIGSYHFVFEDEQCRIPEGGQLLFEQLPEEYSHLYMAIEGELAAVICIEDPLREEASDAIKVLKAAGVSKVVMMTGDSERTARAVAARVGVDEYFSEVLPEDKARFVEQEKAKGRKVIMVGDGINDSPALSAADVGIAISDGAEIAREVADIVAGADNLYSIVTLKQISNELMKRIHGNYGKIVGFNTGLILLGVAGILQPTTSALLHNTSTILISLKSMQNLLSDK